MKNVLIIGGTGILGRPLVAQFIKNDECIVYSISLERAQNPSFPSVVEEIIIDRYSDGYKSVIISLNEKINHKWDAVIDLISYDDVSAEQTYRLFKDHARHFIVISTALVYDRSEEIGNPISEITPLASTGQFGGYIDGKIKLENFWNTISDANWTLLRPYHILGKGSLLGCLPYHNRDPKILEKINNNETLYLANAGNVNFNYIHPLDVAIVIYKIINNPKSFREAYNLANPEIINGFKYYEEIGKQLNKNIKVENITLSNIWSEMRGWEMTTLPHVYSVEKLRKDLDFVPNIPLAQAIKDSISNYPQYNIPIEQIPVHAHMNKLPKPKKPDWL